MFRLDDKVALVMGCGSVAAGWGNGRATAVALARQGAIVYGTDLVAEHAEATRHIIAEEGNVAHVAACDVTRADDVERVAADCVERFGRIDVLVNNVGVSSPGGPVDMDEEVWDHQLAVNLKGAFLACKHVIPGMIARGGGSVVNISSVAGLRHIGKPQVGYAAAKAALMQFTRTTAVIHAPDGVRLNCVVPGLMNTPLVSTYLAAKYAGGDVEGFVARRHAQVPMGHMGSGWDVAHAVAFLASDEASYITGTEIVVDGGLVAATR